MSTTSAWDLDDRLLSQYHLSPAKSDRPSPSAVSGGGGLEPEGDNGASWQDQFAQLESALLENIGSTLGAAAWAPPPQRPSAHAFHARAEAALVSLASGAANQQPPPPKRGCAWSVDGGGGGTASDRARQQNPRVGGPVVRGQTTADMGNGVNMDKRRCRQLHRDDFMAAIAQYRASQPPPRPPTARRTGGIGVQAWIRKRPLLPHDTAKNEYDAVTPYEGAITTHCCLMKPDLRRMFIRHATFAPNGGVFGEGASSDDVYGQAGTPLVAHALNGGKGTLLLYGQTGSGKTLTATHFQARAAEQLFSATDGDGPVAAAVEVTAVEVAGRTCRDLHTGEVVSVLQTANGGATLKGVVPKVATSARALSAHLGKVLASRTTEATAVNATSSRSHALITMRVGVDGGREGRLTLLDCAGSEWAADSDAHDAQRRREGAEINASLHALKQCVRALSEQRQQRNPKGGGGASNAAASRVPYRDSTLTRILRDSFETAAEDGVEPSRLVIVGCVSPGAADCEHTTSTLRTVMELSATSGYEQCATATTHVPRLSAIKGGQPPPAAGSSAASRVPTRLPSAEEALEVL